LLCQCRVNAPFAHDLRTGIFFQSGSKILQRSGYCEERIHCGCWNSYNGVRQEEVTSISHMKNGLTIQVHRAATLEFRPRLGRSQVKFLKIYRLYLRIVHIGCQNRTKTDIKKVPRSCSKARAPWLLVQRDSLRMRRSRSHLLTGPSKMRRFPSAAPAWHTTLDPGTRVPNPLG
jgi:hypothetical protein